MKTFAISATLASRSPPKPIPFAILIVRAQSMLRWSGGALDGEYWGILLPMAFINLPVPDFR